MNRTGGIVLGAAAVLAFVGSAAADVSVQIFRISSMVETGDFAGQWQTKTFLRDLSQPLNPVQDSWQIPGEAFANGAEFGGATIEVIFDPVVTLNFNASAGATNTAFVIDSLLLSFPTIGDLQATASAAVSVTESGLFADGFVSFAGGFGGNKAYEARINNNSFVFAQLIDNFSAMGPIGTVSSGGAGNTGPLAPFAGPVTATSISSHFSFTLSARDRISGTSTFEIIPSPGFGTLALLGLGAAARRRRR